MVVCANLTRQANPSANRHSSVRRRGPIRRDVLPYTGRCSYRHTRCRSRSRRCRLRNGDIGVRSSIRSRLSTRSTALSRHTAGRHCDEHPTVAESEGAHNIMTTIVVPLDGSVFAERAIRPACSLAARLEQARVLLVRCAPDDIDAAQHELDDRASLYSEVVDIETRLVGSGDPAEVILAIAATEPDGMLCMATHGKGGIRTALWAASRPRLSVDRRSHSCSLARVAEPRSCEAERGRLLVCSDGSALVRQHHPHRGDVVRSTPARAIADRSGGARRGPRACASTSSQPRGRSCRGAPGCAGDAARHPGVSCANQGPPR